MLSGTLKSTSQERYYQYVKYLALSPSAVPPHPDLYTFHFGLSDQEYAKLSRDTALYGNARPSLPINMFSNGSVRCGYQGNHHDVPDGLGLAVEADEPANIGRGMRARRGRCKRKHSDPT